MKFCLSCHKDKELSEFWKNQNMPDGLQYYCKQCLSSKRGIPENVPKNTVKMMRERLGMYQGELADTIGVSRRTIVRIEMHQQNIGKHTKALLVDFFQLTDEAMLYE